MESFLARRSAVDSDDDGGEGTADDDDLSAVSDEEMFDLIDKEFGA